MTENLSTEPHEPDGAGVHVLLDGYQISLNAAGVGFRPLLDGADSAIKRCVHCGAAVSDGCAHVCGHGTFAIGQRNGHD